MAAHQALLSLGFSRQEHWSGLPFPSPVHDSEKWKWSHSVMCDYSRPHGLQPTRLLRPWDFPGKSTGVGSHCYLLGQLTFQIKSGSLPQYLVSQVHWPVKQQEDEDWIQQQICLKQPEFFLLVASHPLSGSIGDGPSSCQDYLSWRSFPQDSLKWTEVWNSRLKDV